MIAAQNSYLICIDNQSKVPDWESDLLCGLSTGTAQRERKYHTNDGSEQLFKAKRPIILNGIDLALRDDLLSRSVLISRPPIPDTQRQDEKQLLARFESAIPELLGVIFDVLSSALCELPNTTLESKPRMADFALWVTASEKALGWKPGSFMHHYDSNRCEQAELAIESDSFGQTLREFLIARNEIEWTASWQQVVSIPSSTIERKGWPTTAKAVTTRLKRLAPALREVGIHFSQERNGTGRFYKFWKDVSNVSHVSSISEELVETDHLGHLHCVPQVLL